MDYDSDTIAGWESKGDFVNLILSKISARFVFFTKLIFKWDIKYLHTYRFVFSQFLTNRKSKISDKIISVADFSSISLTYLAISNPITMVLDLSTVKMNLNFSSKFDIEWLHWCTYQLHVTSTSLCHWWLWNCEGNIGELTLVAVGASQ